MIKILPDDVLLEIFDLCIQDWNVFGCKWHLLGHVCRRWRQIVFASPHRLNLRIICTQRTPVKTDLAIWPAYPITIRTSPGKSMGYDNIIAALEHKDRVYSVQLTTRCSQFGRIAATMREPFPLLTHLYLFAASNDSSRDEAVLPVAFLGGSAPRLQTIILSGVHYPTIPTLLSSARDLVKLQLYRIPPTSYISPKVMIACLAVLSRLENIIIDFESAERPVLLDQSPSVTQAILPALTTFEFRGTSEYLEDLVPRINSPQLDRIHINFLNPDFQAAQLSRFIDRALEIGPVFERAEVTFFSGKASFAMDPGASYLPSHCSAMTVIRWEGTISHLPQALSQIKISARHSNVVHLKLEVEPGRGHQLEGMCDMEWLRLLRQFSNVKTLRVSRKFARHVALALEDATGEMDAELFPSLDLILLEGQRASSIQNFVAARRLSGRSVTVVGTITAFNERLKSYVGN